MSFVGGKVIQALQTLKTKINFNYSAYKLFSLNYKYENSVIRVVFPIEIRITIALLSQISHKNHTSRDLSYTWNYFPSKRFALKRGNNCVLSVRVVNLPYTGVKININAETRGSVVSFETSLKCPYRLRNITTLISIQLVIRYTFYKHFIDCSRIGLVEKIL